MGDPSAKAPAPTAVLVQQITRDDPVIRQATSQIATEIEWAEMFDDTPAMQQARKLLNGLAE